MRTSTPAALHGISNFTQLRIRVALLEKQLSVLREVIRLLLAWKHVVGSLLDHQRFDVEDKQRLLVARLQLSKQLKQRQAGRRGRPS